MKPPEERFDELRRNAGLSPAGPAASPGPSYHSLPLLKPPVWTWEIPAYFFVGGAAGACAMLGVAARINGADEKLVRDARLIAALGAIVSTPLLISDLGRPERFLNMLRVFKPQSPMSVGAWALAAFGATSGAAAFAPFRFVRETSAFASAASGLVMATYTGVLLGVSAIPVWSQHAHILPLHFGASALGSGASLLELRGHDAPALNTLAVAAATFETVTAIAVESESRPDSAPLRRGGSGKLTRIGALLSGPVPLALRLFGGRSPRARRLAAVSSLAGSLITRFAWVEAGKVSARDPHAALAPANLAAIPPEIHPSDLQ
jgi:hypothetical protein